MKRLRWLAFPILVLIGGEVLGWDILGWVVLLGVLAFLLRQVQSVAPHSGWPIVASAVFVLDKMWGYPTYLSYLGIALPWLIMAWAIMVFATVATLVAMLYAWDCSWTMTVPSFDGYKAQAVSSTTALFQRFQALRSRGR